jgi:hypothetical protein
LNSRASTRVQIPRPRTFALDRPPSAAEARGRALLSELPSLAPLSGLGSDAEPTLVMSAPPS